MPEEIKPGEGENGGNNGGFTPPVSQEALNQIVEARLARERAKFADYDDLKTKAERFDAAEQENLSDLEKERQRADVAEKKAATYEAREQRAAWAKEIVKDSNVPASALRGSTKEELTEHFEELKALITPAAPKRTATPHGKAATDDKPGSRAAEALRSLRKG
jgi:hypothetical protein